MIKQIIAAGMFLAAVAALAEDYVPGPDSVRQANVPQGKTTKYEWTSKIYAGTVRDYWVYVPAQYKPDQPARTMVFQDGGTFVNEAGAFRTTIVLDNLIHKGDLPVIIGVFVNPGVVQPAGPQTQGRFNRSYEYDAVGDRYPRFLMEEILPEVGKLYNLSSDPNDRAISGSSSGGNCSFNAAFSRPDAFRRVLSFIGGFTNLPGDHIYPSLGRKIETPPPRVFLPDGTGGVDIKNKYELKMALEHTRDDSKLL